MKARLLLPILMLVAAPAVTQAKPAPGWKAFADCAAAYRINAAIVDPGRSPSMKAQISETGDDYEAAAVSRFKRAMKADEVKAKGAVQAYAASRMPTFQKQKRQQVEKFIDACPQTDE